MGQINFIQGLQIIKLLFLGVFIWFWLNNIKK